MYLLEGIFSLCIKRRHKMSKRKRKSTYQKRYKKPLIRGKFYRVIDTKADIHQNYLKRIQKRINTGL